MAAGDAGSPEFEVRPADWLDYEDALARVLAAAHPMEGERLLVPDARGRALAEEVTSPATLPPWDNAAMDGYAVRGSDVETATPTAPVVLAVTGRVRAGEAPGAPVGPGQAVRIMTGAPLPPGADSVVRVEHTDREASAGVVRVLHGTDAGRNVRPAGQDMQVGDLTLAPGDAVHAGAVGVLAAMGRAEIWVHRVPEVAIVVTGDELRGPDRYDDVSAGRGVPESNGPMLAAAVASTGAIPRLLPVAPDEAAALGSRLEDARTSDVVLTVGGASMGEADLVKRVLDSLGYEQEFWRVSIRPGSPVSFGHVPDGQRRVAVFGLPGNPASAFVTFEVLVRPYLLRSAGHRRVMRRRLSCVAAEDLHGSRGKTHFLRVVLEGSDPPRALPAGPQGSGLVRTLGRAHGLAIVPRDADGVPNGSPVDVLLLDTGPAAEPGPEDRDG